MTTNPYEDAARQRKVTALVAALAANGFTADEVAAFTDEQQRMAEAAAGVRSCSADKTWPLVVDALREHARGVPPAVGVRLRSARVRSTLAPNVRRADRGYVRVIPVEILSGGDGAYLHLADADDASDAYITYPRGYDSRCGWCYLGAPHTTDAHTAKVAEATR